MKSIDVIASKLKEFQDRFPQISFLYEFDETEQTHIVEVRPIQIYEENEEYKDAEGEFTYYFDRKFAPESLMFVSENSLIRVTKPIRVFENSEIFFFNDNAVEVIHGNAYESIYNILMSGSVSILDPAEEDLDFSFQDNIGGTSNEISKNNYSLAA